MDYKIGDVVISGTDSSPVISQIVKELESMYIVDNVIYAIHGEKWEKMKDDRTMYEHKSDIRRKATQSEIDIFLDYYNT